MKKSKLRYCPCLQAQLHCMQAIFPDNCTDSLDREGASLWEGALQ
jgi:hypothetical protein